MANPPIVNITAKVDRKEFDTLLSDLGDWRQILGDGWVAMAADLRTMADIAERIGQRIQPKKDEDDG